MEKELAKLKIFRYDPDVKVPWFKEYQVPMKEGLTVQKALFLIAEQSDDPPAFRPYMCNRGQCACCVLTIDGKNLRACTTQVRREMTVEPIYQYPVVRDLVVDFGRKLPREDGASKAMEGTLLRRPPPVQGNRVWNRPVVRIGIPDPSPCPSCETRDCLEACGVNRMENLEDRFGRRMVPRSITLKAENGGIQFSGFCLQCPDQACVRSCPTGAIQVRGGLVMGINPKACIGCGICLDACPADNIWMNLERGYAVKCDLCGGEPQCVQACPHRAIAFQILPPPTTQKGE